jgi:hypothetical protein
MAEPAVAAWKYLGSLRPAMGSPVSARERRRADPPGEKCFVLHRSFLPVRRTRPEAQAILRPAAALTLPQDGSTFTSFTIASAGFDRRNSQPRARFRCSGLFLRPRRPARRARSAAALAEKPAQSTVTFTSRSPKKQCLSECSAASPPSSLPVPLLVGSGIGCIPTASSGFRGTDRNQRSRHAQDFTGQASEPSVCDGTMLLS